MRQKLMRQKVILVISTLILLAGAIIGLVIGTARNDSTTNEPIGKSCRFGGNDYTDGSSFASTDKCNTCSCQDGRVLCTARACSHDIIPDIPI